MRRLTVGLIGSGFMGKGHSMAYRLLPQVYDPPPALPILGVLGDATEELAASAAARFGFAEHRVGWRGVVEHPDVDIVDITAPNHLHREIAVAAAAAGKHLYCEKPLAVTLDDARAMLAAAEAAGVRTMVGFQYLKTPATLAAQRLIADGAIGEVWNVHATFHQDALADPALPFSWRFERAVAGSGALGDLGAHVIAIVQALVGDIAEVCALTATHVRERPVAAGSYGYDAAAVEGAPLRRVENDDSAQLLVRFAGGATGTLSASRVAQGRKVYLSYEIQGSRGTIRFDHERMNELELYLADDPVGRRGFRTVLTGPEHPHYGSFWPVAGCGLGFGDMKVIEIFELLDGIANDRPIRPDFRDGVRVNAVIDAAERSVVERAWVGVPEV